MAGKRTVIPNPPVQGQFPPAQRAIVNKAAVGVKVQRASKNELRLSGKTAIEEKIREPDPWKHVRGIAIGQPNTDRKGLLRILDGNPCTEVLPIHPRPSAPVDPDIPCPVKPAE